MPGCSGQHAVWWAGSDGECEVRSEGVRVDGVVGEGMSQECVLRERGEEVQVVSLSGRCGLCQVYR